MNEGLLSTLDSHVLEITFHRPEKKNAFTVGMYEGIVELLEKARQDKDVRVVVFKGAEGSFTAGNDLGDFMQNPPKGQEHPVFKFLMHLVELEKPMLCAVDGPAIGVGTTMLLHADVVYASDRASFKMPFVPLGLVPEAGSSVLLPRLVGTQRAAELLLFGERFDARRAEAWGLVNRVVPHPELDPLITERARVLARLPPEGVRATKALLRQADRPGLREAIAREGRVFVERLGSPEAMEAFQAFFEKREPDFSKF